MESPSNSIRKIMMSIKHKLSQLSFSSRSFPSSKSRAHLEYFGINGTKLDFNSNEMNPRIQENNLAFYQKEPDISTPKCVSFPRKSIEENKSLGKSIFNDRLCSSQSMDVVAKKPNSMNSKPNLHFQMKISSCKSVEMLRKPIFGFNLPKSPQHRKDGSPPIKKKRTLFDVLSNFYLTKKFINTLKSITSKRSPKFLSQQHFDIINDLVFFFDIWKQNEKDQTEKIPAKKLSMTNFRRQKTLINEILQKKMIHFLRNFQTFGNSSTFMIIWNLIHLFFILFFFFTIPIEACFDVKLYQEYKAVFYIQYIAGYFFLGDILVNCNTAVYLKGKLIRQRHQIMKTYIKSSLLKDIISILSIFLQLYKEKTSHLEDNLIMMTIFRLFFFLRMINFSSIIKRLEEMFFIDQSVQNILSLFKLVFRIIMLSHIFACLWFYIGTLSLSDSWITFYDVMPESWWIKYIYSFYFVCITMNTVGYGDLIPQNSIEKVFTIIFIYIACGIFAYSINSIGVIVSEIAKRENDFQKDLNIINEFMKNKNINFDLRMRVRKYLEYIWYEEKIEKLEEQSQIIEKLSDSLKEELLLEANGSIIRDLKMFTFNFSEDLLRNTIPLLKEVRYTPGDLIFMKGDFDNKALYIVLKGKVEIFLETNKMNTPVTVLKNLQTGDIFGEIAFFSDQERSACARSIDFTTAYMIKKEDFLGLLKKYPRDYQKFCEIKDNINFYEDYKDLYIKCYSCNEITHLIQNCPNIKYKPIKDVILHRYFISVDQVRRHIHRQSHHLNAIQKQELIETKAFEMQANIFPINESERTSNNISDYSDKLRDSDSFESSSLNEQIIKEEESEEEKEEYSGELLKGPKENKEYDNAHQSLKTSFDELKSKIKRKNNKRKHLFLANRKKSCSSPLEKFFENCETDVQNALICELNGSLNNLSLRKNEENNPSLKSIKSPNEVNKLKSLLNYISELNEKDSKTEFLKKKTQEEKNNDFPETDFNMPCIEIVKSWDFYFPHNNCEKILEICNLINQKKRNFHNHHPIKSFCSADLKRKRNQGNATSRRQGISENFEKLNRPKMINNGNSLIKKNFFQSSNVMEKFMNETKFDPEKFKKKYRRMYQRNKIKNILSDFVCKVIGCIKTIYKNKKKGKNLKKRIWKENILELKNCN